MGTAVQIMIYIYFCRKIQLAKSHIQDAVDVFDI